VPFDNTGVIEVAAGAVVNLAANQVTPDGLGTLRIGGRFLLQGNLDNIGSTITVAPGGSFDQLTLDGTLEGGTIVSQGGTLIGNGTLAGVTSVGTFDVTGFWMVDGATQFEADATGPAAIQMTNGQLEFLTTRTLDNLVITAAGSDIIEAEFGTLTLDPTVTLISNAATVSFEGTVVNQGSIEATSAADTLYLNLGFTNAGWIGIQNGAALNGTLANTGTIVLGGEKSSLTVYDTGLNQGSIDVTGSDDVISLGTSFTNAGWIGVQNSSTLIVGVYSGSPGGVINTGTIALGNSSTSLVLYGSQSLANLGGITGVGANLIVGGTLDNTGGTLILAPNATFGALNIGSPDGVVQGGTVINDGGTFTPGVGFGGILSDLTWRGPLDLTSAALQVNDVLFQSEDGGSPGNVVLNDSRLYVLDGGTLDGVSLIASGGTSQIVGQDRQWGDNFFLTLGTTATIDVTSGSSLSLHGTTVTNLGTIDATGPGAVAIVQSYYDGRAVSFVNAGLVNITNGGVFQFLATADQQGSSFLSQTIDNSGLIEIASGGTFDVGAYMSGITNTGTINLNGATSTLKLEGTVIAAALDLVTGDGVLAIDGLYDNTGETLTIGPSGPYSTLSLPGKIIGGTIDAQGGTVLFNGGTLDDVVWDGPLILGGPQNDSLYVANGLSIVPDGGGPSIITLSGTNSVLLDFLGSGSLYDLDLTDQVASATIVNAGSMLFDTATTLSVAAGTNEALFLNIATLINDGTIANTLATGSTITISGSSFVNDGTIELSGAGNALVINTPSFSNAGEILVSNGASLFIDAASNWAGIYSSPSTGVFDTSGTIALDGSSSLILGGTVTEANLASITTSGGLVGLAYFGLLENTGKTLEVGAGDAIGTLSVSGTIQGGTIDAQAGAVQFRGGTLDDVVWDGPLVLGSIGDSLNVTDGFQIDPTGGGQRVVTLSGNGSGFSDDESLNDVLLTDQAAFASINAPTLDAASTLTVAALTAGTLGLSGLINDGLIANTLSTGTTIVVGGSNFTNAGTVEIGGTGDALALVTNNFTNSGEIVITNGASLYIDAPPVNPYNASLPVDTFSDTGMISLDASSALILGGTVTDAALAGIATSGGLIDLVGTLLNTGGTLLVAPETSYDDVQLGENAQAPHLGASAGVIQGGTVIDQGGSLSIVSAVLDGVTWLAPVDLTAAGASLSVIDGGTLAPLAVNTVTTIDLTGAGGSLTFDAETLIDTVVTLGAAGGTVTFGGPIWTYDNFITVGATATPPPMLTLASSTTLDAVTPGAAEIDLDGDITNQGLIDAAEGNVILGPYPPTPLPSPPDLGWGGVFDISVSYNPWTVGSPVFDNRGTILAMAGPGSTFSVGNDTDFSNEGLIQVGDGDKLLINDYYSEIFTNTGTIALILGGTVDFAISPSNLGTIQFASGTAETLILDYPGTLVTASIQNFSTGDAIEFGDSLTIASATLSSTGTLTAITSDGGTHLIAGVTIAPGLAPLLAIGTDPATGDSAIQIEAGNTLSWTGDTGSDVALAANWQGGANASPGTADALRFTAGGGGLTGTVTARSLLFQGQNNWTVTGSLAAYGAATVAADADSYGDLTVGANAALRSGWFTIGDAGIGELSIDSGGTVITSGPSAVIASTAGASGSSVGIDGAGSNWQVSGALTVGDGGSGQLNLSQGATVNAGSLTEGNQAPGVGQVSVVGATSLLNLTGDITVGDLGTGVLSILSGGQVTAADMTVGLAGSASGAVTISGAGSLLRLSGTLDVGTAVGTGELTIGPSASVIASVVNLQGQVVLEGGLLDPTVITVAAGNALGGYGAAGGDGDLVVNDGTLLAQAGTRTGQATQTVMGTIAGQGVMQIDAGATMELTGPVLRDNPLLDANNDGAPVVVPSSQVVNFAAGSGALRLDDFAGFAGTIGAFNSGDTIEIPGLPIASETATGTILSLFDATHDLLGTIDFTSAASAAIAAGFSTTTSAGAQCFVLGTMIETVSGPRAVETLKPGDDVRTVLGSPERIVWVGRRSVACARHPKPASVWPIRIARGAFGADLPARDLFVSPDHAIYVAPVLIPAKLLVNGTSIRQVQHGHVVYHHIELSRHDVVLAEGLPAETYLDTGDRASFAGGPVTELYPNFAARTWEMRGCAPLVLTGEILDATRARLAQIADRGLTRCDDVPSERLTVTKT